MLLVQSVEASLTFCTALDEADVAQNPEVLGHVRLRQMQHVDELTDRPLARDQHVEDLAAVGAGDRGEDIRGGRGGWHCAIICHRWHISRCGFAAGSASALCQHARIKPGPNVGQTVGHFEVDDLDSVVGDLTGRGVVFEEYESPKTINFIAQIGPARGAWFKDPDGNVFGLREGPVPAVA